MWVGKLNYPKDEIFFNDKCFSYFRESYRSSFRLTKNESVEINFVLTEVDCVDTSDSQIRMSQERFQIPLTLTKELEAGLKRFTIPPVSSEKIWIL